MYDHTLHRRRKYFYRYCLQTFRTAEKLKCYIKHYFKINGEKTIQMPTKCEYFKLKKFGRKIKSPFTIYADLKSILVSEVIKKQNPNESYTNKYQKHVACGYGYKLVCVDDKFKFLNFMF